MTGLPVVFGLIGRNMLSQALFHFVADRAGVFTDHHKSGRPIHAMYKHLRNSGAHTAESSLVVPSSTRGIW